MNRSITFTADRLLIDEARAAAKAQGTTLNALFGSWIEQQARKQRSARAIAVIEAISKEVDSGGKKFTREERNARRN